MKYNYLLVLSNGQATQFESHYHISMLQTQIIDGARFVNFEDVPVLINLDRTLELIIDGQPYQLAPKVN